MSAVPPPTLEVTEILQRIERFHGRFERAAVEAAVARREEIVPELLGVLENVIGNAAEIDAEEGYMAHLYAMFLLAQFREVRAYPLIVRLALLPGDLLHSLCGDFVTEDLGRVLASVCGGDIGGIQSLIENEDADEYARAAGLSSLLTLVACGRNSREEILDYFAQLFRVKLPRQPSLVWDDLVASTCDLFPAELLGDIQRAYEEDLIDPGFIGWEDVERDLANGREKTLARLSRNSHRHMVEDTPRELGRWACFHEKQRERPEAVAAPSSTLQRHEPKAGRNDPCPCGSGKKYKKCHGG